MKYGFVGLGNMGRPMALRLANSDFALRIFDLDREAMTEVEKAGAAMAENLSEVARQAEIVLVSLPTPQVVEKVLLGPDGLGQGSVRIIVDLSTTGPSTSKAVAAELARRQITLIDAPVSGGTPAAANGTLAIMAAGPVDAFEEARAVLSVIGDKIFHVGEEAGMGQTVKVINNMLLAAATVSALEGLVLGAKSGIDPAKLLDIINVSSGRSFATEVKIAQCVLDRSFPMRFATALLDKDVRLCLATSEELGVPMQVCERVGDFLTDCMAKGLGDRDYGEIIKVIEAQAGAEFGLQKGSGK